MGILDNFIDEIQAGFSEWVQIDDKTSNWTIEDFPYEKGVDEQVTNPHCWKCVTVNQCWFKNEKNKKPIYFNYDGISYGKIGVSKRGIYHPNCHCKEKAINVDKNKISFVCLDGKIEYFFRSKLDWFYAWGYKDEDKDDFVQMIIKLTAESFVRGDYEKVMHDKQGFRINVLVRIPGVNNHEGHYYDVKTCWMIFPNGKLKCNTLIGGRAK